MAKISTKGININDYLRIEKETNDTALLYILQPVVYSKSHIFNSFNYKEAFAGLKVLSVKIDSTLIFDSFFYILLEELRTFCKYNNIKLIIVSDNDDFDAYWEFLSSKKPGKLKKDKVNPVIDFFEGLGKTTINLIKDLTKFIEFLGEIAKRVFLLPKNFRQVRWVDLPSNFIKIGVNSLGICLLIVFLIGIIIGYVGAIQLQRFGVGSFLASLVGIAVTRELSPIMVGIIMAGRTGSSFTAEIGTMKVSDEVDALRSFGFDRFYFLVFPRLIAITLALPLIVSICNIAGIVGGFVAGNWVLSIGFREFQMELLDSSLSYWDVLSGVLKSSIFGMIIAIVGCFKGFQVSGGAESVGRYTTSSVVTAIFLIVLVDAIFSFLI